MIKSIKFLAVLLDENLSWKDHIKYIENKVAKNIGLSYRAKLFLDKNSATCIILFIYSHLFKLCKFIVGQYKQSKSKNKLLSQQKHAARIIINRTPFDHNNELFKSQKI